MGRENLDTALLTSHFFSFEKADDLGAFALEAFAESLDVEIEI